MRAPPPRRRADASYRSCRGHSAVQWLPFLESPSVRPAIGRAAVCLAGSPAVCGAVRRKRYSLAPPADRADGGVGVGGGVDAGATARTDRQPRESGCRYPTTRGWCSPPDAAGAAVLPGQASPVSLLTLSGLVEIPPADVMDRAVGVGSPAARAATSPAVTGGRTPVADGRRLRSSGRWISPSLDAGLQASGPARFTTAIAERFTTDGTKNIRHHGRVQQQRRHQSKGWGYFIITVSENTNAPATSSNNQRRGGNDASGGCGADPMPPVDMPRSRLDHPGHQATPCSRG